MKTFFYDKNNKHEYELYIEKQKTKSLQTIHVTERWIPTFNSIWDRLSNMNLTDNLKTALCLGARSKLEVEFFENKGLDVDGIDLHDSEKIIKCDMSKIEDHPIISKKTYDLVFSNESIEHCLDIEGLARGLDLVCEGIFVASFPGMDESDLCGWHPALHKFMTVGDDYEHELLKVFTKFKPILVSKTGGSKGQYFFILEKIK